MARIETIKNDMEGTEWDWERDMKRDERGVVF